MTREKAVEVHRLLCKIEDFEACLDEIYSLEIFHEIKTAYGIDLTIECEAVIKKYLETFLKDLEQM